MRGDDPRQALVELLHGLRVLGRIESALVGHRLEHLSSALPGRVCESRPSYFPHSVTSRIVQIEIDEWRGSGRLHGDRGRRRSGEARGISTSVPQRESSENQPGDGQPQQDDDQTDRGMDRIAHAP